MGCVACGGEQLSMAGHDASGRQRYRCGTCGRRQTARSRSAFAGYRFPDEIIALAVRWYLQYRLSYADVAELLAGHCHGNVGRERSRRMGAASSAVVLP